MDGSIGELLRIEVDRLGQAENDVCKFEAGRFYGVGATADGWSDLRPGSVEGLPEALTWSGS